MQSDDGREELRQGSFDLDRTAERILEVGLLHRWDGLVLSCAGRAIAT